MAHIHGVFDSDAHFIIDPITRHLKNEISKKVSVIQFDHDSERFTFELPRIIEGHDMTTCNVVQVHYLNIEAKTKKENKGLYEVNDLQVSPEDENTVICSWLISQNATQLSGSISFLVRFSCVTEGEVNYIWQTAPYTAITVTTGINNSDYIVEQYADILEAWKQEIEEIIASGGGLTEVNWEDIKNRPFGVEGKYYEDINFDGVVNENTVITNEVILNEHTPLKLVKVGECPNDYEDYIAKVSGYNSCYKFQNGDEIIVEKTEGTMNKCDIASLMNVAALVIGDGDSSDALPFIVAVTEPCQVEDLYNINFPESGVYVAYIDIGNAKTFPDNIRFEKIRSIPEEYMPKSVNETISTAFRIANETSRKFNQHMDNIANYDILPQATNCPEGSFARVVDGQWEAVSLPIAEESEY